LVDRVSTKDIVDAVEAIFEKKDRIARQVKIYLCRKHSGQTLKIIGAHFRIGESGVCQASRRIKDKMKSDKNFKRLVTNIEENISLSQ